MRSDTVSALTCGWPASAWPISPICSATRILRRADLCEGAAGALENRRRQADVWAPAAANRAMRHSNAFHSGGSDLGRKPEALDRRELEGREQWDGGERGSLFT